MSEGKPSTQAIVSEQARLKEHQQTERIALFNEDGSPYSPEGSGGTAETTSVTSAGFGGILSPAEDTVQKALDALDSHSHQGGSSGATYKYGDDADHTIPYDADLVLVTAVNTAVRTYTLPAAADGMERITLVDHAGQTTGGVSVVPSSGEVLNDGIDSIYMLKANQTTQFISDGTSWTVENTDILMTVDECMAYPAEASGWDIENDTHPYSALINLDNVRILAIGQDAYTDGIYQMQADATAGPPDLILPVPSSGTAAKSWAGRRIQVTSILSNEPHSLIFTEDKIGPLVGTPQGAGFVYSPQPNAISIGFLYKTNRDLTASFASDLAGSGGSPNRALFVGQTDPDENGIYWITSSGAFPDPRFRWASMGPSMFAIDSSTGGDPWMGGGNSWRQVGQDGGLFTAAYLIDYNIDLASPVTSSMLIPANPDDTLEGRYVLVLEQDDDTENGIYQIDGSNMLVLTHTHLDMPPFVSTWGGNLFACDYATETGVHYSNITIGTYQSTFRDVLQVDAVVNGTSEPGIVVDGSWTTEIQGYTPQGHHQVFIAGGPNRGLWKVPSNPTDQWVKDVTYGDSHGALVFGYDGDYQYQLFKRETSGLTTFWVRAENVIYDNSVTGLTAEEVGSAIDEVVTTVVPLLMPDPSGQNDGEVPVVVSGEWTTDNLPSDYVRYVPTTSADWPEGAPDDAGEALDSLALREFVSINTQTDDYTIVLSDIGKAVEMDKATAVTLTVPPNATTAFPVGTTIEVYAKGAGTVTVAEGAGVTIRNVGDLAAQYATASLRKRDTDEWVLTGELA